MDDFATRPLRNLRRLRLEAGLTETELGLLVWPDADPSDARARLNVTMRGCWPSAERIVMLAEALEVEPEEFYLPLD